MKLSDVITIGTIVILFILVIGLLIWNCSGYGLCNWYNLDTNNTIQRKVAETCLKW